MQALLFDCKSHGVKMTMNSIIVNLAVPIDCATAVIDITLNLQLVTINFAIFYAKNQIIHAA